MSRISRSVRSSVDDDLLRKLALAEETDAKASAKIGRLSSVLTDMSKGPTSRDADQKTIADLQAQLAEANERIEHLERSINETHEEYALVLADVEREKTETLATMEQLRDELDVARSMSEMKTATSNKIIAQKDAAIADATQTSATLETQLEKAEAGLASQRAQIAQLQAELGSSGSTVERQEEDLRQSAAAHAATTEQLRASEAAGRTLEGHIASLQSELVAAETLHGNESLALMARVKSAEDKAERLETAVTLLTDAASAVKGQYTSAVKELESSFKSENQILSLQVEIATGGRGSSSGGPAKQ